MFKGDIVNICMYGVDILIVVEVVMLVCNVIDDCFYGFVIIISVCIIVIMLVCSLVNKIEFGKVIYLKYYVVCWVMWVGRVGGVYFGWVLGDVKIECYWGCLFRFFCW